MRAIGIDPGQTGGLVVTDDGSRVIAWLKWRDEQDPPTDLFAWQARDVLALEKPFAGFARASLTVAEWCGKLLVQVPEHVHVVRPTATTWRGKVLKASRVSRSVAKRLAIEAAMRELVAAGAPVTPDLAEAWCMARYAYFYATSHRNEVGWTAS